MLEDYLITCGVCGKQGFLEDEFFLETTDDPSVVAIRCGKCHGMLYFDSLCYIDIPSVIKHENTWQDWWN